MTGAQMLGSKVDKTGQGTPTTKVSFNSGEALTMDLHLGLYFPSAVFSATIIPFYLLRHFYKDKLAPLPL